ncbi:hypothetical protein DFH27DRAFT_601582 [Peziza echinospora]|nr:hypothetical protein DFH27DRAFT_601582 [Peziza echinospora]
MIIVPDVNDSDQDSDDEPAAKYFVDTSDAEVVQYEDIVSELDKLEGQLSDQYQRREARRRLMEYPVELLTGKIGVDVFGNKGKTFGELRYGPKNARVTPRKTVHLDFVSFVGRPYSPLVSAGQATLFQNFELQLSNWGKPYNSKEAANLTFSVEGKCFRLGVSNSRMRWYLVLQPRRGKQDWDLHPKKRATQVKSGCKKSAMIPENAEKIFQFIRLIFQMPELSGAGFSQNSLTSSDKVQLNQTQWSDFQRIFMAEWDGVFLSGIENDSEADETFWDDFVPVFHAYDFGQDEPMVDGEEDVMVVLAKQLAERFQAENAEKFSFAIAQNFNYNPETPNYKRTERDPSKRMGILMDRNTLEPFWERPSARKGLTHYGLGWQEAFGNFSATQPFTALNDFWSKLDNTLMRANNNIGSIVTGGAIQGYNTIKQTMRHSPEAFKVSKGLYTASLGCPPFAKARDRENAYGKAAWGQKDKMPLGVARKAIKLGADTGKIGFRIEEIIHIDMRGLLPHNRNFHESEVVANAELLALRALTGDRRKTAGVVWRYLGISFGLAQGFPYLDPDRMLWESSPTTSRPKLEDKGSWPTHDDGTPILAQLKALEFHYGTGVAAARALQGKIVEFGANPLKTMSNFNDAIDEVVRSFLVEVKGAYSAILLKELKKWNIQQRKNPQGRDRDAIEAHIREYSARESVYLDWNETEIWDAFGENIRKVYDAVVEGIIPGMDAAATTNSLVPYGATNRNDVAFTRQWRADFLKVLFDDIITASPKAVGKGLVFPHMLRMLVGAVHRNLEVQVKQEGAVVSAMERAFAKAQVKYFPHVGNSGNFTINLMRFFQAGEVVETRPVRQLALKRHSEDDVVLGLEFPFLTIPTLIVWGMEAIIAELSKSTRAGNQSYIQLINNVMKETKITDPIVQWIIVTILTLGKVSPLPLANPDPKGLTWIRHDAKGKEKHRWAGIFFVKAMCFYDPRIGEGQDFPAFLRDVGDQHKVGTGTLEQIGLLRRKNQQNTGRANPRLAELCLVFEETLLKKAKTTATRILGNEYTAVIKEVFRGHEVMCREACLNSNEEFYREIELKRNEWVRKQNLRR